MDQEKMAELNLEEILLTGFARLPEKSVLFSKYNGTISVTLLVTRSSGKILEVASEDFSPLQINYFNKLLRGEEISTEDGMFRIEQLLARNYQSSLRHPRVQTKARGTKRRRYPPNAAFLPRGLRRILL